MSLFISFAILALLLLAVGSNTLLWRTCLGHDTPDLPPGPHGKPIIGNALQVPKERPWMKFTEWGSTFGDIFSIRIFSRRLIVLNSFQLALELFEKRSSSYCDRPRRPMAELCGFGRALLFQNYGEEARQARKLMHSELTPRGVQYHQRLQEEEARAFARRLLDDPSAFKNHIRRATTSSLLTITYGHQVDSDDDLLVFLAESVMSNLADVVTPNKYLIDAIPILKFVPEGFPGSHFQTVARISREVLNRFMDLPFAEVKAKMAEGMASPSFTSNHLEDTLHSISESEQEILKWTAGGMFAAGSDTTVSVLASFILAMSLHPHVQDRAQEEMDNLLGVNILPTFADRERLPYVECIIKEVLRWNPAAPLIGHSSRVDDIVNGFKIPAGSVVMANTWAIAHDDSVYRLPFEFNPDRFLKRDDPSNSPPPDPRMYVFGFGRRSCPGVHLADALLYIMIATTLSVFRISPEADQNGALAYPDVKYSTGAVSHPLPFKCRIVPRSQEAANSIKYATDA